MANESPRPATRKSVDFKGRGGKKHVGGGHRGKMKGKNKHEGDPPRMKKTTSPMGPPVVFNANTMQLEAVAIQV